MLKFVEILTQLKYVLLQYVYYTQKKLTIKSNDKPSKDSLLRKNLRILNRLRKKGQKSFFNIKKTFAKYTKISR